jgi:hypothetical protein
MDEEPFIVVLTEHYGRYRVEFDYNPAVIALLKKTVPGPVRHWIKRAKRWEVSTDWVGPLAAAFLNAGIEALGLNKTNIAHWFDPYLIDVPTTSSGHDAYTKGLCVSCESVPYRPGGTECVECHHKRLERQHRMMAALVQARAIQYLEAHPAAGSARTTYYPLPIDWIDIEIVERDYTEVVDILIAAEHDQSPSTCPICGRKTSKDIAVHTTCRTRLLAELDSQPFSSARNKHFQDGLCTVCFTRPHRQPHHSTCAHCASLIDVCRCLRVHDINKGGSV